MPFLKLFVGATVLSLVAAPLAAAHTVHHVPQEHPTIMAAVGNAQDGDTIIISTGTYPEAVVVTNFTGLTIKGKGKVIIDPPGAADGITLTGCDTCLVEKVRVTDAVNGVKLVDCFTCSIEKCRVEAVSGIGIALEDCNNCFVEKCTILGAGADGIGLGASGAAACQLAHVAKNKIIEPGDDGVDLNGINSIIEKNTVIDAGGNGYRTEAVPAATTNTFTKCKSIGALGNGFEINGTLNSAFFCTDIESGVNGVHCTGTGFDALLSHKSTKPGGTGILIEAGLDTTGVDKCKIKQPGADGISMQSNLGVISKNKVTKAGNDGFAVGGNGALYEQNSATGCTSDGFQLLGTGNELTKNKAKGSVNGFDLDDQSGGGNIIDDDNKFGTTGP